jgi:hypothetical protein
LHDGSDFLSLSSSLDSVLVLGFNLFKIIGSVLVFTLVLLVFDGGCEHLLIVLVHVVVEVLEHFPVVLGVLTLSSGIHFLDFGHLAVQLVLVLHELAHDFLMNSFDIIFGAFTCGKCFLLQILIVRVDVIDLFDESLNVLVTKLLTLGALLNVFVVGVLLRVILLLEFGDLFLKNSLVLSDKVDFFLGSTEFDHHQFVEFADGVDIRAELT